MYPATLMDRLAAVLEEIANKYAQNQSYKDKEEFINRYVVRRLADSHLEEFVSRFGFMESET